MGRRASKVATSNRTAIDSHNLVVNSDSTGRRACGVDLGARRELAVVNRDG